MSWEAKAEKACLERGYTVLPHGFEHGYVFVQDKDGRVFPISEVIVAKWIKEDNKEG